MRRFRLQAVFAAWIPLGLWAIGTAACGGTKNWTESTVVIEAEGIGMEGDKIGKVGWVGTGFWIDQNYLATNAHVATRALKLVGVDDDGTRYHFNRIVGLDRAGDIAILKADRAGDKPGVEFMEKPDNPKELRGREIVMVGNSGGLGLGFFHGRVTNVLGEEGNEQILHNATVVGGSSGSAIYDKEEQKVLGIHHSGSAALNIKIATASWHIAEVINKARAAAGVEIDRLFTVANIGKFANIWGKRQFCIEGGENFKVSFNVPRATDILTFVAPADPNQMLVAALVRGGKAVLWKGVVKGKTFLPFSLQGSGSHDMLVVNPKGMPKVCGVVGAGEIAWEKGIK